MRSRLRVRLSLTLSCLLLLTGCHARTRVGPMMAGAGRVVFVQSPSHATVTSYEARLRVEGTGTLVATTNLGKPEPYGNGEIWVSLRAWLSTHPAGNYTVSVAAIAPAGTVDSVESNAFTLPLSA
jgi:hypothetical protein